MLTGLHGSLLSHYFAEQLLASLFAGRLGEQTGQRARGELVRWWRDEGRALGPVSSLRTLWDRALLPVTRALGFSAHNQTRLGAEQIVGILTSEPGQIGVLLGHWNTPLGSLWRDAVRTGIHFRTRWCVCSNGHELRLVDTTRTYSRLYLEFDLERTVAEPRTFDVFWSLLRAEAFHVGQAGRSLLEDVLAMSARHHVGVSRALRLNVLEAVECLLGGLIDARHCSRPRAPSPAELSEGFEESLIVVYRILFLLFAEARGLAPTWHPVYRDSYTIESLRDLAEGPRPSTGLWETLQAIARLAHDGCRAGTLVVAPFNGRLFSPHRSPWADTCRVSDEIARQALLALSTARGERGNGRTRIDYRDLGVEQLGAVYESLLDYAPTTTAPGGPDTRVARLSRGGVQRKTSGSFYTPQSITDYLVRRTLHPLVDGASSDAILRLRILDPAMGSGAFLVAACRYLAGAYESAQLHEGARHQDEIGEHERAGFRRLVAQRCLFGVDFNPTAVQLARVSLWLATLAAGRPLSFLDHHLRLGDSLIGASLRDIGRRPAARRTFQRPDPSNLPLFSEADLEGALGQVMPERLWIADAADDTADVVRDKETRLDRLTSPHAPLARWKALADLWCACWLWPDDVPTPQIFAALSDQVFLGQGPLPADTAGRLLTLVRELAAAGRYFHWMLEFPEIYFTETGVPVPNSGFDAVLGNPPWDMLRVDQGSEDIGSRSRAENARVKRFIRESGIYGFQTAGQINRYQLFLERALGLVKTGGRVGLVLPSGLATDHGSSKLRRALLDRCSIDALVSLDNRRAIFPIHRSVRFLLLTATTGSATTKVRCRFGEQDAAALDTLPDEHDRPETPAYPVVLTRSIIQRISGDELTIPEVRGPLDLALIERLVNTCPTLGSPEGWGLKFGRELNASEDRPHFTHGGGGLPVLEGKHVEPFRVHLEAARHTIPESTAVRLLDPDCTFRRARLAYRDVASSNNRLTLIAAILPTGSVTTHSLFCQKTRLVAEDQAYLCGMLNSYVANYLVRLVVTTHLGSATVERLRVPKLARGSVLFRAIGDLSLALSRSGDARGGPELQALAAKAYGLSGTEYRHILGTLPLVDETEREESFAIFDTLV